MNRDKLCQNLLNFDRDAYLEFGNNNNIKYECYIVGGGAMLLLNLIPRATQDIDVLRITGSNLVDLMKYYDMNMNVSAHIDCFPDGYSDRAIKLNLNTKIVDFYVLSVEDIVVSKLASGREKDIEDIHRDSVINMINWNKLDELVELAIEGMLSDYRAKELADFYDDYKRECKK